MKIVEVAPWEETVPPTTYGGTELVVSNIVEGLVKKGHEVYLLATGNSQTSARLVPIFEKSLREMLTGRAWDAYREFYKFYGLSTAMEHIQKIQPDIIHNHMQWRYVLFSNLLDIPFFSTIHRPLDQLQEQKTYKRFKNAAYVSISNNQRKILPQLNWVKTIYNGIDVTAYTFQKKKDNYYVFLGHITPEKGLYEVCLAIKKTNHRLKIAGKIDNEDKEYFDKKIKPCIDNKQITFIGEVDHAGKNKLLTSARGVLYWLNWEEPFNLVVTESLACGTPVIVNSRGSMPELMEDGKTGFLVNSLDEMAKRLDDVASIDPTYCRAYVQKHFSTQKMVDEYERLMYHLLEKV